MSNNNTPIKLTNNTPCQIIHHAAGNFDNQNSTIKPELYD